MGVRIKYLEEQKREKKSHVLIIIFLLLKDKNTSRKGICQKTGD